MKKNKSLAMALTAPFLAQKVNGRSKYMPHQGVKECRRRRKQMGTGEFAGG